MADQEGGPVVVSSSDLPETTAAWTSATAANTTLQLNTEGYGHVIVTLNQGSTITAGAVTFEVSDTEAFTNAYLIGGITNGPAPSGSLYTLVASNNASFSINVSGWLAIRLRLSTAITGTGTVNVGIAAMAMPTAVSVVTLSATSNNLNTGQPSIATTATLIAAANAARRRMTLVNSGNKSCFIGPSTVTATTGIELINAAAGGNPMVLENYKGAVWGIIVSGSALTISYAEESA